VEQKHLILGGHETFVSGTPSGCPEQRLRVLSLPQFKKHLRAYSSDTVVGEQCLESKARGDTPIAVGDGEEDKNPPIVIFVANSPIG